VSPTTRNRCVAGAFVAAAASCGIGAPLVSAAFTIPKPAVRGLEPKRAAKVRVGHAPRFAVGAEPGATMRILVATSGGTVVADGPARPRRGDAAVYEWRPARSSWFLRRPGIYYWQGYGYGSPRLVGTASPLEVTMPRSWRRRGQMPRSTGRRGHGSFLLSVRNLPASVPARRFAAVAGASARRWGLRRRGWTSLDPAAADGRNVVGFSSSVPAAALGVERDLLARVYRNGRYMGTRLVERDIGLNPLVAWQAGPGYPDADEVDLETVLLHELGHFAGNKRHASRCRNTPMIRGLASGEWWRTPRDRYVDCRGGGRALGARSRHRLWRMLERRIVVRRVIVSVRSGA
jgi:hypothetical protein